MPQVKKIIYLEVERFLAQNLRKAQNELWRNKYELKKLSDRQHELKKLVANYSRMVEEFRGKRNGVTS